MEPKVLEEIGKHYKHGVIEFDWEPVRRQPKRYGIFYPIIGYMVSLLAIIFMGLGVFMYLFLIAGSIFFFGGIFCANGIIEEYRKIRRNSERQNNPYPENAISSSGQVSMENSGKVVSVCTNQRRTDPKENVGKGLLQKGLGLVGDSHAGTEKEVSLLAIESIQRLCKETGISAGPGCFAENITTEGFDLTSLSIGSHLEVGEAKLVVIQIGKDPSQAHAYNYQGHSILPKEGLFCRVIESGEIKVGDIIRLIED